MEHGGCPVEQDMLCKSRSPNRSIKCVSTPT